MGHCSCLCLKCDPHPVDRSRVPNWCHCECLCQRCQGALFKIPDPITLRVSYFTQSIWNGGLVVWDQDSFSYQLGREESIVLPYPDFRGWVKIGRGGGERLWLEPIAPAYTLWLVDEVEKEHLCQEIIWPKHGQLICLVRYCSSRKYWSEGLEILPIFPGKEVIDGPKEGLTVVERKAGADYLNYHFQSPDGQRLILTRALNEPIPSQADVEELFTAPLIPASVS